MTNPGGSIHELGLLETIERDPDVNQASIATQLDVAVGTVNWHLKRLIEKGYVKIKRANRKKLRYIITPEGIAFRARLTMDYVEQQFLLYRNTRQRVKEHITRAHQAGFEQISVRGEGDVADICRLTCLEQDMEVIPEKDGPVLVVDGLHVRLEGLHEH
jgi:predicted transcriptional regulator